MAGLGAAMEPQEAPENEGESNVSPEEQAMYERVVRNALEIIYPKGEESLSPQIREALTAGNQPTMNLAMASVSIVTGLVQSAKQAGQKIPGDVLFHAGAQIVELVAEAAEGFKLAEYSEEDIERAFYIAVDMFGQQGLSTGDIDPETMKADFAELQKADQEGRLDDMLPGAVAHAEKMPKGEEAPADDEERA